MARILLTGASSFTGLWIAEALVARGHQVVAPLKRGPDDYSGLRQQRVARLRERAEVLDAVPFSSPAFLDLVRSGRFDVLAHHAADIPNYRAADYDVGAGVARNVAGAGAVLQALAGSGGQGVIATGTTFEAGEGGSNPSDLALSPYGLSKTLTNDAWRHYAKWAGLGFGRFVIAAPFGPLEEGRFAWSLFQRWFSGRPGIVRTPRYIRDNIPAFLLGEAYAALVEEMVGRVDADRVDRPQGLVGTQEAFARRLAAEMAPRLGLACDVETVDQPVLLEPESRINSTPWLRPGWEEGGFWDAYAAYYQRVDREGLLIGAA